MILSLKFIAGLRSCLYYVFTFSADDGEVFKVKKSSHSKKIRRQIDREKEERKKKGSPKVDATSDDKIKEKNQIIATEEVTIKIKNPIVRIYSIVINYSIFAIINLILYPRLDLLPYLIRF